MTNIEMIEKLSKKAGVTRETAEEALKKSNWDILDAMLYIERNRGVDGVTAARGYSSSHSTEKNAEPTESQQNGSSTAGWYVNRALSWGLDNMLVISKNGSGTISIPIVFFIALLIFSVSLILVLMIVGLFFDFRYSFSGPQLDSIGINCAMDKIYNLVQGIKRSIKK